MQTITSELVEKKAWAAQIRRTTLEQRRALQGWKALMSKVGKGTGKRAPQLLAEETQAADADVPNSSTGVDHAFKPCRIKF